MLRRGPLVLVMTCAVALGPTAATAASARWPIGRTVPDTDWPAFNNDPQAQRFSTLQQIQKSNVAQLRPVCSATLGDPIGFETGPVVIGGVMYATTRADTYAIDATNCNILWTHHVNFHRLGIANRGVAYANGMVFRGTWDGVILAINASTGATIWHTSVTGGQPGAWVSVAPVTWRGTLIVGTAGADIGQQGRIVALDQATGKILWHYRTVPKIGDPLASTWMGAQHIAGGSTWSSFTLDAANGIVWAPTGNPGPDYNDSQRVGANLWTNSILALNASTGALLDAYQLVPRDYHDWDVVATPILASLPSGATLVLAVAKDGILHAYDPVQRRQVWQTPVTRQDNGSAPLLVTGTHFCPGTDGGVSWNGPAFSPLTGTIFVHSIDWCSTIFLSPHFPPYDPPDAWLGGHDTHDALATGYVMALAAQTGATLWSDTMPTPMVAGLTPTAGGLVFTADLTGTIYALDADTGGALTTINTGLPVGGGVITYATGGNQYVAVAAGMKSEIWKTKARAPQIVILGLPHAR
jgi:alcohol dehydrogenase (cytochrome c)